MSADNEYDPAIYSNTGRTIYDDGGADDAPGRWQPYTWRELAEERQEEILRLQKFRTMVTDLDRNANGRHEGDWDVADATGISQGNPQLRTGNVLGYSLGGHPYVMPERGQRHDATAWGAR